MALQLSTAIRNARGDVIESTTGASPTLEFRTGLPPANCAAADTGTLLASMTLPSDWMAAASGGSKSMLGTWEDTSANATGDAGYFRIKQGATCHIQGTVSEAGGGGDMELQQETVGIVSGQRVTVAAFTINDPNG